MAMLNSQMIPDGIKVHVGKTMYKPPMTGNGYHLIPTIYGDLRDGLFMFYPHFVTLISDMPFWEDTQCLRRRQFRKILAELRDFTSHSQHMRSSSLKMVSLLLIL